MMDNYFGKNAKMKEDKVLLFNSLMSGGFSIKWALLFANLLTSSEAGLEPIVLGDKVVRENLAYELGVKSRDVDICRISSSAQALDFLGMNSAYIKEVDSIAGKRGYNYVAKVEHGKYFVKTNVRGTKLLRFKSIENLF